MASDSLLYRGKYRRQTSRAQWWDWYEGIYFVTLNTQNRRHNFGEIEWDVQNHKKIMRHSEIGKFANEEIPKIMNHHPYAYIPSWIVMPDHIHLIIMIDVRGRMNNHSIDHNEINHDSAVRTARRDNESYARCDDETNHDSAVRTARRDNESYARRDNESYARCDDETNHDSAVRTARRDNESYARCDDEINNAVRTARRDNESYARCDNESYARCDDETNHDSAVRTARRDNEMNHEMNYEISARMSEIAPKHGSLGSVIGQYKRAVTMHARINKLPFQWQSNYYASILKDQIGFDRVKRYIENNVAKWEIKP